jgi:hypothetical protein
LATGAAATDAVVFACVVLVFAAEEVLAVVAPLATAEVLAADDTLVVAAVLVAEVTAVVVATVATALLLAVLLAAWVDVTANVPEVAAVPPPQAANKPIAGRTSAPPSPCRSNRRRLHTNRSTIEAPFPPFATKRYLSTTVIMQVMIVKAVQRVDRARMAAEQASTSSVTGAPSLIKSRADTATPRRRRIKSQSIVEREPTTVIFGPRSAPMIVP